MKQPWDFARQAEELVEKMSLDDKAALMSGSSFWHLQSLPHWGLGAVMVSDGPHGLRKQSQHADHMGLTASVPATCFPTAVTLASSWNRDLIEAVGAAIGRECRAEAVSVLLAPGINIKRSPLCGRNFEYYSEDPFMAGVMATHFIRGVHSTGTGTSLKHFAVNNQEAERMVVDSVVDRRTLFEIYLPAFEAAVTNAMPWTLMCAYNRLNGIYCSEHEDLLSDILRTRWGFKGLVVTDWGAVNHRARGIAAGLELEMPSSGGVNDRRVAAEVRAGRLDVRHLDRAARRVTELILAAQYNAAQNDRASGEPSHDALDDLQDDVMATHDGGSGAGTALASATPAVDFDAHHQLARQAASEGAVLLKNHHDLLPLAANKSVALIGSFAAFPRFQGAGSSQVNARKIETPLDVLIARLGVEHVRYAAGFDHELAEPDTALIEEAVALAADADYAVIMAGLPPLFEAEGFDRTHLRQPPQIEHLITAVAAVNPNCVVVLSNGAPIEMPWADQVPAILEMYLAGQAGALALADLLFGDVVPSGRLAETFPVALADGPAQQNFANHKRQIIYREGLNVGYRYFCTHDVPVLFPFGHGLSYSRFSYDDPQIIRAWSPDGESCEVAVTIQNIGDRAAAEVVQLYVRDVEACAYRPDRELKGFEKIFLQAGEAKQVRFTLDRRAFSYFDTALDDWDIEAGEFDILFGASSVDIRTQLRLTVTPHRERHAPRCQEAPYVVMTNTQLAALGLEVGAADPIKPYHANTSLADIRYHWLGRRVAAAALRMAAHTMGKQQEAPVAVKMREEMIMSLRLQTLQIMSAGALTPKRFDLLLHALNNRWLRFFWRRVRR